MTCSVQVSISGDGYRARAGRGAKAKIATCTSSPEAAARSAAAKYFHLDSCNVQTAADIRLSGGTESLVSGSRLYLAELPGIRTSTSNLNLVR